jgi:hypothetical protein
LLRSHARPPSDLLDGPARARPVRISTDLVKKSALALLDQLRTGRAAGKLSAPCLYNLPVCARRSTNALVSVPAGCARRRRRARECPGAATLAMQPPLAGSSPPFAARSQRERRGGGHRRPPTDSQQQQQPGGWPQQDVSNAMGRASQRAFRAWPYPGSVALRRRRRAAVRHGRCALSGREQDGRYGRAATRPRVTHVLPGRDRRVVHRDGREDHWAHRARVRQRERSGPRGRDEKLHLRARPTRRRSATRSETTRRPLRRGPQLRTKPSAPARFPACAAAATSASRARCSRSGCRVGWRRPRDNSTARAVPESRNARRLRFPRAHECGRARLGRHAVAQLHVEVSAPSVYTR